MFYLLLLYLCIEFILSSIPHSPPPPLTPPFRVFCFVLFYHITYLLCPVHRFIASIKREPFPAGISAPSSETEALIEDAKKSYVSITDSQSLEVIEPTEEDETDGAHGMPCGCVDRVVVQCSPLKVARCVTLMSNISSLVSTFVCKMG